MLDLAAPVSHLHTGLGRNSTPGRASIEISVEVPEAKDVESGSIWSVEKFKNFLSTDPSRTLLAASLSSNTCHRVTGSLRVPTRKNYIGWTISQTRFATFFAPAGMTMGDAARRVLRIVDVAPCCVTHRVVIVFATLDGVRSRVCATDTTVAALEGARRAFDINILRTKACECDTDSCDDGLGDVSDYDDSLWYV